jgi:spoIIIJ-associated protein
LIGYHGQTLEKLQHIVSQALSHKYKQPVRVVIDINDYRQKRTTSLENLARRAAQQVIESGQDLELQPMNPADRRIVHKLLNDEGKVRTESIGDGKERRIVVKPLGEN